MKESVKHMVKIESLSVGYHQRKKDILVLEDISFEMHPGELIGLVGANGVGKSTLLRTLAGMQPQLNGNVFLNGLEMRSYNALELATLLSVVLTEAPASRNLTVYEFVALGRQPYTNWIDKLTLKDKEKVDWALEQTETAVLAHKRCYELSDGQMQRAAIARALAQDTKIILLDEPTTHLDLYHRAYIVSLLKRLSEEQQKTILFSTHEIDLAIQISDKILVLSETGYDFGTPDGLIKAGCFATLFPEDTIEFDPSSGRFTIKK